MPLKLTDLHQLLQIKPVFQKATFYLLGRKGLHPSAALLG